MMRSLAGSARRAFSARNSWPAAVRYCLVPLIAAELVLCLLIILKRPYTEIDWQAYMQEVEGPVLHGVWDYSLLRGDTGPLVYPGGFVLLYAALRRIAGGDGSQIVPVQLLFAGAYVGTLGLAAGCYALAKPARVPPWSLLLVCVSLRLHSIYLLRLFNDCWAMLLFWLAAFLFCRARWGSGCVAYSLAVSIKANVLLTAPGLLLLLLQAHGTHGAMVHIGICAAIQLVLGLPFLATNPTAYVRGALGGFGDLKHKWTVNWKFLPAHIFHAPAFPMILVVLHLVCLAALASRVWTQRQGGISRSLRAAPRAALSPEHVVVTLLSCNVVGVIFARSLHFQFYCWYIHSVPMLLWRCERLPSLAKLGCLVLLEYAWSYGLDKKEGTSTPLSSACLQVAHAIILYAIWNSDPPKTYPDDEERPRSA